MIRLDESNQIYRDLKKLICKTCKNISYYDNYFCKCHKHTTKAGFLHRGKLIKCDSLECVFWCNECEGLKNSKTRIGR